MKLFFHIMTEFIDFDLKNEDWVQIYINLLILSDNRDIPKVAFFMFLKEKMIKFYVPIWLFLVSFLKA